MNRLKSCKLSMGYVLVLPALILVLIFKIYPIITTILEGFFTQQGFSLENYRLLFKDPMFYNSLWITFKFNIITTPLQIVLALALALLVNNNIKGVGVFRTIYYLPVAVSLPVAVVLWNMMLNADSGVINSFLTAMGLDKQPFLIDKNQALYCIILITSWKGISYWMMFLLAGLKDIDTVVYEASKIDGAGWWRTLFSITLPMLKRVFGFVVIADTTINLLMFAPMHMITSGGPQMSTNVLMYEAYKSTFIYIDRGRASAIITIMLIIVVIICGIQSKLLNEKD